MHRKLILFGFVLAATGVATAFMQPRPASADEALHIASTLQYDVQTTDVPVRATWDVTITNNDPETRPDGSGTVAYYHTIHLPVIRGATSATATDESGEPLAVFITDVGKGVAESAAIALADPLYFGESYSFRLNYTIQAERSEGILITPRYVYIPLITAGDEATVVVNTPPGDPWQTTLDPLECPANRNTFTCTGGASAYAAATVEVVQPAAIARTTFPVELEDKTLQIELAYLQGEDAAAAHQRELLVASLPLIEEVYGIPYDGPPAVAVSHGGRQAVLGYEGLATCSAEKCELVVSPVADDYTVIHEASHLWSDIYKKRWLAEGFSELVSHEVVTLLPPGLFVGEIPERRASGPNLQLDDWGGPGSIIGADDSEIATIESGYDYSLRFLQQLRSEYGLDMLRSVNRSIVATEPADSRRFMDLVEAETGDRLDQDFLLWVFPPSYESVLPDRRLAHDQLEAMRERVSAEGLPAGLLASVEQQVAAWRFSEALAALDQLDSNLEAYAEFSAELEELKRDAEAAGLTLSPEIEESLNRFDFSATATLLASSRKALDLYVDARARVGADRSPWEQFGLLGSNPDGELNDAASAFEEGAFTESASRSQDAVNLITGASETAFRRVLALSGLMALMALLIGGAITIGRLRYGVPQS